MTTPNAPLYHESDRVRWYVNRLRCMTPAEIPFRVARTLKAHAERWLSPADGVAPPPDLRREGRAWICARPGVGAAPYVAAADRIGTGRLDVFALQAADVGTPPRWNRDPKTGIEAPLGFGMLLDYRNPRLVGDVRYLWEMNRHGHLVTLAQAYALTGEAPYAATIRRHLESWFEACPHGMGANWSSALEPAVRLINWSAVWHLLGGALGEPLAQADGRRFCERWLRAVYGHARFVRSHLSRHSSANNHLIGEAAGLYVAARTWPFWPESRRWLADAAAILERETLRQNAPDGVNREQAVAYQQFELDLLLSALLAAEADGARFSSALRARLERMLEYFAAIMDAGGHVPMFGDSDDGFVARLSQEADFSSFRSLLATGAVLFERDDFRAKAGALDDKTRWLLGERASAAFEKPAGRAAPPRTAFPEGGYYVLGCDFDTNEEIKLVADAGPLGLGTLAAHGHADALSFTLSVGGHEVLVDPGTYTYRSDTAWRAYFRGTAAHNTVRIDGQDQSEPGGTFMWLRKARAHCTSWRSSPERDEFEGWHDGYTRLADPVVHRRRIVLDKRARRIVVDDLLEMSGTHDVELLFHCGARCCVDAEPGGHLLRVADRAVRLQLPLIDGARAEVRCAAVDPIGGWTSPRFDVKRPAPTIVWRARLAGAAILRSVLAC
jgi:hypothetical protein